MLLRYRLKLNCQKSVGMASVVVTPHKVKRVYVHGKGKPKHSVKKRVHYKIVCHTGRFTRCLRHPKPYIDSNASLVKITEQERNGQWKLLEGGYKAGLEIRGYGGVIGFQSEECNTSL